MTEVTFETVIDSDIVPIVITVSEPVIAHGGLEPIFIYGPEGEAINGSAQLRDEHTIEFIAEQPLQ